MRGLPELRFNLPIAPDLGSNALSAVRNSIRETIASHKIAAMCEIKGNEVILEIDVTEEEFGQEIRGSVQSAINRALHGHNELSPLSLVGQDAN